MLVIFVEFSVNEGLNLKFYTVNLIEILTGSASKIKWNKWMNEVKEMIQKYTALFKSFSVVIYIN